MAERLLGCIEWLYPPRRGAEWGSGGVYGLKLHRGILYYTVSFDAYAYFVDVGGGGCRSRIYGFELVGHGWERSGGDTYNAVDAVDYTIFFGGWVHAPPVYRAETGEVLFTYKYSHVHAYDILEDRVRLLWREGLGDEEKWAGEVSEIVYDPVSDSLLLARGDGHAGLGVYRLDPWRPRGAERVDPARVLKASLYRDMACFAVHRGWEGFGGLRCLSLGDHRLALSWAPGSGLAEESVDGAPVAWPRVGAVASAYAGLYVFVRGGVIYYRPGGETVFYRLMDFPGAYGPLRTKPVILGGGLLIAFNAFSHSTLHGTPELPRELAEASRAPVAPTTLLYLAPPQAAIVAVLGARITSMEPVGDTVLLGAGVDANHERYDAARIDTGAKQLLAMPSWTLTPRSPAPPLLVDLSGPRAPGEKRVFGGVPLQGYREPRITVYTSGGGVLRVYTYTLTTGPGDAEADRYQLRGGRDTVELGGHRPHIVSFSIEPRPRRVVISLE